MENIILTEGNENLKGNPQIYLKVNSIFKKLGFKEVKISSELKENTYCDKLTLFITPQMNYRFTKEYYTPERLRKEWGKIQGYNDIPILKEIKNYDDEVESIIINDFHLGDYYKNRNFVIFFFPIHYTRLGLGLKNKFLFELLENFSKEIIRIKPKEIDVSEKIREELINKFLSEIKVTIINSKSQIREKLSHIEELRKDELQYLSQVKQLEEQTKVLRGTYKTIGGDIERKIQEIKKLPFVTRVGISRLGIRIDFKHIDLEFEGKKVELGECYCYLNPNGLEIKNKNCVIYNKTTYHSPHIETNSICFGEGKRKAFELLSSLKFKELAYFIYLYLKTYNEGDTYLSLSRWKKCKDNGGKYESEEEPDEEDYD